MKKQLLITLADKNYIEQARQLFSSVYWNAGWAGDYMLLAHEVPDEDLAWFSDKGILVKKCIPFSHHTVGKDYHPVVLDKFYIFSAEFKKWENIVFIDSDVIVRSSIERLAKIKGFGAAYSNLKLSEQFSTQGIHFDELDRQYNLSKKSFNTGVMAFSTDIIGDDTFKDLRELYEKYVNSVHFPEEAILNLYFYKKWREISCVYDLYAPIMMIHKMNPEKIRAVALHFIRIPGYDNLKPWIPENQFYSEWKSNLGKAAQIDFATVQKSEAWGFGKISYYNLFYNIYFFYVFHFFKPVQYVKNAANFVAHLPERIIGIAGVLMKKICPSLYTWLKRVLR